MEVVRPQVLLLVVNYLYACFLLFQGFCFPIRNTGRGNGGLQQWSRFWLVIRVPRGLHTPVFFESLWAKSMPAFLVCLIFIIAMGVIHNVSTSVFSFNSMFFWFRQEGGMLDEQRV